MVEKPNENIRRIVEKALKSASIVGNIHSSFGYYPIEKIYVTRRGDARIEKYEYLFVLDDDGYPIVYQVTSPSWYRRFYDFQDALIAAGQPIKDEHGQRYKCVAALLGKLAPNGDIVYPKAPPKPMSDVYKCTPELVKLFIEPLDDWKVKLGINPETGLEVYVAVRSLVRQSLLISGAQGTGKTTALLTLIKRCLFTNPPLKFVILDWTGEFRALMQLNNVLGYRIRRIAWHKIYHILLKENPASLLEYLMKHPLCDTRTKHYKLVEMTLLKLKDRGEYPSLEKIERLLQPVYSEMFGGQGSRRRDDDREIIIRKAAVMIRETPEVPRKAPQALMSLKDLIGTVKNCMVTIIDFSSDIPGVPSDPMAKKRVAAFVAEALWEEALSRRLTCVIVSDEAHRICPESWYGDIDDIWIRLATEGGRNGIPLWIVARRLSLVRKSVTVETQQNFIGFNAEDVDRRRIIEDLGEKFGELMGALPQGEAVVKSQGFRIPGQVIHVKFDPELKPYSGPSLKERFRNEFYPPNVSAIYSL